MLLELFHATSLLVKIIHNFYIIADLDLTLAVSEAAQSSPMIQISSTYVLPNLNDTLNIVSPIFEDDVIMRVIANLLITLSPTNGKLQLLVVYDGGSRYSKVGESNIVFLSAGFICICANQLCYKGKIKFYGKQMLDMNVKYNV